MGELLELRKLLEAAVDKQRVPIDPDKLQLTGAIMLGLVTAEVKVVDGKPVAEVFATDEGRELLAILSAPGQHPRRCSRAGSAGAQKDGGS